ncbi:MAG TPA: SDR family oxidoreductase [Cyclobacteriaceae bacterium]|nr:SDR family oxidoreductase [Cyclobacteriaceae bacterium]
MNKNVLILGATSDMAVAFAKKFAQEGYSLTLAARNKEALQITASDLNIRFQVDVNAVLFDALDFESHEQFYKNLKTKPDIAICVFGLLGDQLIAQKDWTACLTILNSNYTGAVSILNIIANDFENRKEGVIVGISSVAGERGRQSNYLYGSAKAGFSAYLSGLRNRMTASGVHVMTVKPGFVKTKMLDNMKTPGPITAAPDAVAAAVYKAVIKRKDSIYVLWMWRWIMLIIKSIPESVFKKLKL